MMAIGLIPFAKRVDNFLKVVNSENYSLQENENYKTGLGWFYDFMPLETAQLEVSTFFLLPNNKKLVIKVTPLVETLVECTRHH